MSLVVVGTSGRRRGRRQGEAKRGEGEPKRRRGEETQTEVNAHRKLDLLGGEEASTHLKGDTPPGHKP